MVDDGRVDELAGLPARPVVGLLHPGMMGAALGSAMKRIETLLPTLTGMGIWI